MWRTSKRLLPSRQGGDAREGVVWDAAGAGDSDITPAQQIDLAHSAPSVGDVIMSVHGASGNLPGGATNSSYPKRLPCLHLGFTFGVASSPGGLVGECPGGLVGLLTQATSASCPAARHQKHATARPDCPHLPVHADWAAGPQGALGGLPDGPMGHLSLSERRAQVPAACCLPASPGELGSEHSGVCGAGTLSEATQVPLWNWGPLLSGVLKPVGTDGISMQWAQRWLLRPAAPRPCDGTSSAGRDFAGVTRFKTLS